MVKSFPQMVHIWQVQYVELTVMWLQLSRRVLEFIVLPFLVLVHVDVVVRVLAEKDNRSSYYLA